MSGVERDKIRKLHSSEYFTPLEKVQERLDAYDVSVWLDKESQFLDPTCGDGQFLCEVLIRKVENGSTLKEALSTIYGTDLMIDNVDLCRKRLLCGTNDPTIIAIVEQNIQCRDSLKFGYNFEPMGPARRKTEERLRNKEKKLQLKKQKEEEQRIKKEKDNKMRQKNGLPLLA